MIISFGSKQTEDLYVSGKSKRWHPELCRLALRKLVILDSADDLRDLAAMRSLRLEKLQGDRRGLWSIRVNKQWRITLEWSTEGARGVEVDDYHA